MSGQVDDLLTKLGTGMWNVLHFVAVGYAVAMPVPHALAGAFLAPKVGYTCRTPFTNTTTGHNTTTRNECSYFVEDPQSGDVREEQCQEWDFDNSTFSSTVTEEFQLVCDREYLRATYQSMYMIGVLVGSPLNGLVADRFGRKFTVAIGCTAFAIITIASCWLPTFSSLLVSRFLAGMFHCAILKTNFILAMEVAEPKIRSLLGITIFMPWALGTMMWAVFAYFLRDWRWLQLAASLPCVLCLPAVWFLDESPRWLAVRGQRERALSILKKASRWNRVSLPSDKEIMSILKQETLEVASVPKNRAKEEKDLKTLLKDFLLSLLILFRTPRLRVISTVMYLNLLVVGMVYFGLSLSGGNFGINVFVYMALSGVMEIPAYTIMAPIVAQFGRPRPLAICFFSSGIVLLGLLFIPPSLQWLSVTLAMIGKMTITSSFQAVNLASAELFPTEVRTRGISTSFMMSRIGSSCSPFITEYLGSIYSWSPSVVFGLASAVAGVATLALPETLDVALPDTIEDLEKRSLPKNKRPLLRLPTKKTEPSEVPDLGGVKEPLT